jgi:hypothetical protein
MAKCPRCKVAVLKSVDNNIYTCQNEKCDFKLRTLNPIGKTIVINLSAIARAETDKLVVIDRTTKFGNPYKIAGSITRDVSLTLYRRHFLEKIKDHKQFKMEVLALAGSRLGCWCKPLACHGDIIAELLNRIFGYE